MTGAGIILIVARFLVAPQSAAVGYGVWRRGLGGQTQACNPYPWLYVKGVRDIASEIFIFILLAIRAPHVPRAVMAAANTAASLILVGDALIVLRSGGTRASAFGIHGATAAVMLAASAALLLASAPLESLWTLHRAPRLPPRDQDRAPINGPSLGADHGSPVHAD